MAAKFFCVLVHIVADEAFESRAVGGSLCFDNSGDLCRGLLQVGLDCGLGDPSFLLVDDDASMKLLEGHGDPLINERFKGVDDGGASSNNRSDDANGLHGYVLAFGFIDAANFRGGLFVEQRCCSHVGVPRDDVSWGYRCCC